ncbi:hypothetical protein GQ457_01G030350 [Hibiscus cannabinus]
MHIFLCGLSENVSKKVSTCKRAKEMWEKLERIYGKEEKKDGVSSCTNLIQSSKVDDVLAFDEPKPVRFKEVHAPLRWIGPARGWVKLNIDAAVSSTDGSASVGGVFPDDNDEWCFGFSRSLGRCSVLMAELWAVLEGLRHAWSLSYRKVELETDNKEVAWGYIADILGRSSSSLQMSVLVAEIFEWLRKDWEVVVRWISRERNGVADSLAAMGRLHGRSGVGFVAPPGGIMARLDKERDRWLSEGDIVDLPSSRVRGSSIVYDPGG